MDWRPSIRAFEEGLIRAEIPADVTIIQLLQKESRMGYRLESETEFRQYLTRVKRLTANTQNSYVSYMNKLADGNGGHICPGCLYDERTLADILNQMTLTEKQHNDLRSAGRAYISCFKADGVVRHV